MAGQRAEGAVSIYRSKGRGTFARFASYLRASAGIIALLANSAAWAQQLPTGGSVAAGAATIAQPNSSTLNVNQSSNQAVINWNAFSVGRGGTVNFNQPNSSSATLNRVTGSTPSWIGGTINAPGTVLLVNPNGIAITKSGVVNTGSFAASTLDISNADFMAGNYKFTGNGGSAAVRNSGRINVSDGGFAALLGGQIANNGVISARLGKVGLGAGELITLDLAGDGFLSVAVPSSQVGKLVDASGALVSNRGKIRADGGSVFLSAATASNILRDAVNVPGSIRANTVGTHNGRIVIGGGAGGKVSVTGKLSADGNSKRNGGRIEVSGANVALSGKVSANGKNGGATTVASSGDLSVAGKVEAKGNDGQGGRIDLTGANIKVIGALIDASGSTGGGLVRIGGTFQGGHGDPNDPLYQSFIGRFGALPAIASAQTVSIDSASVIDVSAKVTGNGGTAIVWSEQTTSFTGTIFGNGGSIAGNGGFTEVSSHDLLDYRGTTNLLASVGETGTLLLDPNDLAISSGTTNGAGTAPNYVAGLTTSVLKNTDLQTQLANSNITVSASGKITVTASVTWSANTNLTLDAGGTLTIGGTGTNGSIANTTSTSAILTLKSGGAITEAASATIKIANLVIIPTGGTAQAVTLNNGNMVTNLAANVASLSFRNAGALNIATIAGTSGITATGALTLNVTGTITDATAPINVGSFTLTSGNWRQNSAALAPFTATTSFTVNTSNGATFLRVLGGDGASTATAYQITDVYGLQGMNGLGANYALANDINASSTSTWNANKGFVPIQSLDNDFNGNGHTISGLKIVFNGTFINGVGLFDGISASGTVENLNLSGGSVIGGTWTDGSTGALAGLNQGAISNVTSSVAVGGNGGSMGGLVGYNTGTITKSSASGAVSGADGSDNTNYSYDVGGLAGANSGLITLSHASGAVIGNKWVGGLVGASNGAVSDSYATGAVTGVDSNTGGLIGENQLGGTITRTYATGTVTNNGSYQSNNPYYIGGLVGLMTGGSLTYSYSTGTVNAVNASAIGGLVGGLMSGAVVSNAYTTSTVHGSFYTGGLIGEIENASSVTAAYANNTVTSGIGTTVGGVVGANGATSSGGTFTSVYWNKTTSGLNNASAQGSGAGATGRTNAQFYDTANQATNFAGFDFTNVWSPVDATYAPQLYGVSYVVRVNSAGSYQYGDTIAPTFLSLQNGDSTSIINGLVYTTNAPANPQVGQTYTASASGASATSSSGVTYRFVYNNGTVTITTRAVTVTADAKSITYGDSDPALTYAITSGSLLATDNFSGALSRTAGSNAGTYVITQGNLALSSNYTLTFVGANLTIDKKTLTETLIGTVQKTYDKTNTATLTSANYGALVGVINGDSVSLASTPTSGTYNNVNAGTGKTVTVSGLSLTGAAAGNYTIASTASGAIGTIDKKVLTETLTGTVATKTYNGTTAATILTSNYSALSGVIAGDTVSLASKPTTVGVTYDNENAGTGKTITVTGLTLTGSSAGNYTISTASGAIGTITPKAITVSLTGTTTKVYDAGTNATLAQNNYSFSGLVAGDSVSVANTSAVYNNANVGTGKTVNVSGLSLGGADGGNYTINTTASGAIGTITAATLTYVADAANRTYGAANPTLGGTVTGFVGGQTLATATTGTVTFSSGATSSSNVGSYAVTGSGLTANNGNYVFVQAAANATTLTVNKATLTIAAATDNKTYDGTTSSTGVPTAVSGLVNGDTISGFTQAFQSRNVLGAGNSVLAVNAGSGTVSDHNNGGNYTLVYQTAAGTITQATLTIAAAADSKTYDGNTSSTGVPTVVSGLVGGDTASGFTQAFQSRNVLGLNGSTLAVNAGSGTVSDGNNGGNYAKVYQTATGTITPATLTVTAATDTKTYDGNTSSTAVPTVVSGLVGGDSASGFTQAFQSRNVLGLNGSTLAVNAGSGTVSDGNNGANYTKVYQTAAGTITQATLTIAAATDTKTYDGSTSSTGAPAVVSGLVGGDTANGFTQNFQSKNVLGANSSTLAVNAGSGTVNDGNNGGNYTKVYQTATGTITPATLTIAAVTDNKTYDGNTSSAGVPVAFSGLVAGDTISGFVQAFQSKNVLGANASTLAVNPGSGTVSDGNNGGNYTLAYQTAAGTINPAALTITADDKTRVVNAPNPAFTATYRGLVNGEDPSVVSGLSLTTLANAVSPAGGYTITASGGSASNYVITRVNGVLTVTPTPPATPSSQTNPSQPTLPTAGFTIPSPPPPGGGIATVSFTPQTPPPRLASTPSTDVAPAALPQGQNLAINNGLTYPPISQFDANQYSQFKTTDWSGQASEATIFVMIARGVDRDHAADAFIDGFWSGTSGAWTPPHSFTGKVTFSDGAGNSVAPAGNAGFAIAAGTTDFGQLLKTGPVMISDGASPAHWLLATQLTTDGKGLVANDPASGKQVVLNYDAATKTLGGITSVFDANSNKFVPFTEASASTSALAGMQGFTPANFLAVTSK